MNIEFIEKILTKIEFENYKNFKFFIVNKNFDSIEKFSNYILLFKFTDAQNKELEITFSDEGNSFEVENQFNEILANKIKNGFNYIDLNLNEGVLKSQKLFLEHLNNYDMQLMAINKGIKKYKNKIIAKEEENELLVLEKQLENI